MENDYNKVAEYGPLTKYERTVQTPVVGESEQNTVTRFCLESGAYVKVVKVGSIGWKARAYDADSKTIRDITNDVYFDTEEEALEEGKQMCSELIDR